METDFKTDWLNFVVPLGWNAERKREKVVFTKQQEQKVKLTVEWGRTPDNSEITTKDLEACCGQGSHLPFNISQTELGDWKGWHIKRGKQGFISHEWCLGGCSIILRAATDGLEDVSPNDLEEIREIIALISRQI